MTEHHHDAHDHKPHGLLAVGVFCLSIGMLWYAGFFSSDRTIDLKDESIFSGVVTEVLEERTVPSIVPGRTIREQKLSVDTTLPDGVRVVVVINDFVPLAAGDRVYVQQTGGSESEQFFIVDVQRGRGLLALVALFVGTVITMAGKKGLYALSGLIFSFALIVTWIVPRILAGNDPVLIGLIGSMLILTVTLAVSYGVNRKSISALLGILIALLVVGALSSVTVSALHFPGFSAEEAIYLNMESEHAVNLVALVVAGIIIAAIGVLDDIAITQAATVFSLAHTDPRLTRMQLFSRAMDVGRDHISAVINTLMLAYAGASLPLVLLVSVRKFPLFFVINGEIVAEEIVRTLISSTGLVLAVPATTLIAAYMAKRDA
ncbi:MAG: YibE/F family protein [Patescibacteria group bacterium]